MRRREEKAAFTGVCGACALGIFVFEERFNHIFGLKRNLEK